MLPMSSIAAVILLGLLSLVIFIAWFKSVLSQPAPPKTRMRPTIKQVIESVGGKVVSLKVDRDSEVFACHVTYIDQFGERQTRHAIAHPNYRPNVDNNGYYWNRPIKPSMIKANKSAEQIIVDLDAEVQRLKQELAALEAEQSK